MNNQALKNIIYTGLFLIPFVPFLVSSSLFFPFITTKAFAWRFVVEIVFGAWVILALSAPEYRPKASPILYAILVFLVVIGLADLLGVEPVKSFWSNYERMEGYVLLLHLGAFFLVIGSVFRELDWKRWWNTSLAASFLMIIYSLFQLAGVAQIHQGSTRVDGTIGNASYLAVYLLVHIFIALFYFVRDKRGSGLRWLYGLLILLQTWILYYTATRGAILGLLGGLLIVALLNIRNVNRSVRHLSLGLLAVLVLIIGGFFLAREAAFVKDSPVLSRFTSISTKEFKSGGRSFVWPMAWQGIKEKPILGWGQDNFNYVFNEHYSPQMYRLEPWFDRAHNIFLDWAIAGGFLGLGSYLALYVVLVWMIFKNSFSFEDKTILIGLLAAYFFHNLFVFDQLVSYVLFFSLLAYIHGSRTRTPEVAHPAPEPTGLSVMWPVVIIILLPIIYFVNVKPLNANLSLIKALSFVGGNDAGKLAAAQSLERAYSSSRLGRSETVEQIASQVVPILSSGISAEEKNQFFSFAKSAVLNQVADFPEDARYEIIAGTFLAQTGSLDEAAAHFEKALVLIPGKQLVYFEYGNILLNKGDKLGALALFKRAYDLAPQYEEAKLIYLIGAIYTNDRALEEQLKPLLSLSTLTFDDRLTSAYFTNQRKVEVIMILNKRIELDPANKNIYEQYLKQISS